MARRSVRILLTALIVVNALFVGPLQPRRVHATPAEQGCWTIKADMPTSRRNPAAVALDGTVYVMGGRNGDRYDVVERYDSVEDAWETMAPMPSAQAFIVAAAVDGRIYVIGGSDAGGKLGTVQEYNPVSDTWRIRNPMPTPRGDAVAGVVDNKIYVIGGWDNGALDAVEEYDPATNTWNTNKASIPHPVALGSAAVVSDTIYVIGGLNGTGPLTQTYAYDPVEDEWTEKASMPVARSRLTAAAVGDAIYVIGGYNYIDGWQDRVEVYDPASDTWSTMNWMPTRRGDLSSAAVGDTIYVFGGRRSWNSEVVNCAQALDVDCDNNPPEEPLYPSPGAGYDEQPLNVNLSWWCSDLDGDDLTYDVYFSEEVSPTVSTTPALVSSAQISTTYDPPETLKPLTRYYWQIIARDSRGAVTSGVRWVFRTGAGPSIEVEKTASPVAVLETGGWVEFTVLVSNTGEDPVTLTGLEDDIYGDLDGQGTCTVDQSIDADAWYECAFEAYVSGEANTEHENTVTATAEDGAGVLAEAQGSASVEIMDVLPSVVVRKSADPETISEPGGTVEFTVRVNNTSLETLTLTDLVDDIYGNLHDQGDCSVPQSIDAGEQYKCSFSAYVSGNPGIDHQDTVTATVQDDENNESDGADEATVTITDVEPAIEVSKTADPTSVPEPGGDVEFTVVVTNTGVEPLTLATLVDSVYGDLDGQGDCTLPQLDLAPDEAYGCSFSAPVAGDAGDEQSNTVTALVYDDEDNFVYGDDDATVTITDVEPSIEVSKTAEPTSIPEPGGSVTFTLEVANTGVETVTLTSLVDDVCGNVANSSNPDLMSTTCAIGGAVPVDGTYRCTFQAAVSGEPGLYPNTVTATAEDNEGNTADDDDDATVTITDVEPAIEVSKTADPTSVPEPGGDVEFTVVVTNTGVEPLTLATLVDSVYGDLDGQGDCTLPQLDLAPDEAYGCSFSAPVAGDAGDEQSNTVTALVYDDEDNFVYGDDKATVTITDVLPTIAVSKAASPSSLPEPGGSVTFTLEVANTGVETVTLTSLVDDVYGDVTDLGNLHLVSTTCAIGGAIPALGTYRCAFQALVSGEPGLYANTVTATVEDNEGNTADDDDDATVTITDVEPAIEVSKTADPTSVPEPGGDVEFTVVVTNTGVEPLTLATLVDSVYGDLDGQGDCTLPQLDLAPDEAYGCSFSAPVAGDAGDEHTNTVTAAVRDDEENVQYGSDEAIVTITDVLPTIAVSKMATPTSLPEPGGSVTFTLEVANTGMETVALTSLVDDVYGDVTSGANPSLLSTTCATGGAIPALGTYRCAFQASVSGEPGFYPNTVTATAEDNEGNPADDDDDATVIITDVEPVIEVSKIAKPTTVRAGDTVDFKIEVVNRGVGSLTLVGLDDTVFGDLTEECGLRAEMVVGQSFQCIISRTISADHTNTVAAIAEDRQGNQTIESAEATVDVIEPAIQVVIAASTDTARVGDTITYTYSVDNIGDTPLIDVVATDHRLGNVSLSSTTLAVGEIAVGNALYCVDEGDLPGPLTHTVTVTGTPPLGADVSAIHTVTVDLLPASSPMSRTVYLPLISSNDVGSAPDGAAAAVRASRLRMVLQSRSYVPAADSRTGQTDEPGAPPRVPPYLPVVWRDADVATPPVGATRNRQAHKRS